MPTISQEEDEEREAYEQERWERERVSRDGNDLPMCQACKIRPVVDYGCHFCERHQRPMYQPRLFGGNND